MRRALVVAGVEFRAFVRTRSFVIGLVLPPLLGALGGFAAWAARPPEPAAPPPVRIAILDRTGSLFDSLALSAARRNAGLGARGMRLELEPVASSAGFDVAERELENRVREGELHALAEIPADAGAASAEPVRLRIVARDATRGDLAGWLEGALREELRTRALRSPGVPVELRTRLERPVLAELQAPAPAPGEARGLAPEPRAAPALVRRLLEQLGPRQKLVIAGPLAFILFFAVTIAAAPLLQAVLEEKANRVSEILLASISPFELMLGKLLGSLAACGIAAFVYAGTLLAILVLALGAALPLGLLALFAVYLVLSLLLWGALYLALGAACTDMKDAQNLMLPVMLVQILPLMFMSSVATEPTGGLARLLSVFPPSAAVAMLLRLGHDPAPHLLEIALSLALLAASALACVWAAGRVLRVGLLAHGRSASLREIARWVRTG